MKKDKNIKKELSELSPLLAKMKEETASDAAPENYFHLLENSIMEQVALESTPVLQTTTGQQVSVWQRLFSPFGAAGLATLLLVAGAFLFLQKQTVTTAEGGSFDSAFAELTDAEIFNYLAENAEMTDIISVENKNDASTVLELNEVDAAAAEEFLQTQTWSETEELF